MYWLVAHERKRNASLQAEPLKLGANYFDKLDETAVVRKVMKRLEALGYKVAIRAGIINKEVFSE